ncbi:MAG: hypothetical protein MUP76_10380 [Acidimicrobiia bacterium]|nr:hypothetical protein [Acidimicrobiia bacterium]
MFAPFRSIAALRPSAAPALLAGASAVAGLFAATAFLIPVVADRFGISVGTAGLISVVQVGGFTVATFLAGRRIRADRRILVWAVIAQVSANLVSAVIGWFWLLLLARLVAGVGAGLITWLAWIDAMKEHAVMRDVAGVGPLTALVAAPLFGVVTSLWGDRPVFLMLAVLAALPLAFRFEISGAAVPARRKVSPSRSNLVLLGALALLTMAGSSLFIFTVAMAEARVGLDPALASIAIAANAAAGLAGTRFRARSGTAALWMGGIALALGAMVAFPVAPVFYAAMVVWGFCFWMTVPEVLRQVAAWSLAPEERVGDAQGLMALGRVVGPGFGGLLVGAGSYVAVGIEAAVGTGVAMAIVGGVEYYRRNRSGPPVTVAAD